MEQLKYFSTFSGIGGFEIGINSIINNAFCVGYSEINEHAIKVYEEHFNHKNYGDITKINEKELPDFELLVGGFPCQPFSIAGDKLGVDDERGTLFFDISRVLSEKRPKHLVLENVRGLLSDKSGKTFREFIRILSDIGYRIEWQVLNSKNFGAPQNRERIFIVGHLGKGSFKRIFPIEGTSENNKKIKEINHGFHRYRTYSVDGICPTITSYQKAGYARVKIEYDNGDIRELTPIEYERLQGYEDNWTKSIDKYERYATCGNGVTINIIKIIINKIYANR